MEEDRSIIERVKSGQTNEFEKLMNKYGNAIYSLALQMTSNQNDAEEVYQETFQRAFKYLDGYNDEYSFYTWLHKIAVHEVFKLRKKRYQILKMEVPLESQDLESFIEGEWEEEEGNIDSKELEKKLKEAIENLSSKKRTVFVLRLFQGLPLKDIAEILDLTVDNVKILLYRARQEIAKELKGFLK